MATTWTDYSPVSADTFTDHSPVSASEFKQLEPPAGFGQEPFGGEGVESGIKIHLRGFGSPLTKWTTI